MGAESFIIDLPEELDVKLLDSYSVVGVTSGVSVPAYLIDRLVKKNKIRLSQCATLKRIRLKRIFYFHSQKKWLICVSSHVSKL